MPRYFLWNEWDSKERPDRREGKKVSGGHFFSSWENPWKTDGIPEGCWQFFISYARNENANESHYPPPPIRVFFFME